MKIVFSLPLCLPVKLFILFAFQGTVGCRKREASLAFQGTVGLPQARSYSFPSEELRSHTLL